MKLKKYSILLIAIAIFLLISIGSVCANENITDDSDASLTNDNTNVVLSSDSDTDTVGDVPDDTTQEKINTTVETEKDKYEFKEDSNKTISVEVKDNDSKPISVNKNDLSISNGNKSINFEYNSSISMITITEPLTYGNYNLTINYLGNGTYVNSYKNITVKIYGNNTIETETSVVCNGENIEIPVKVYDQVDYIELVESNFNLTLVYTNETGNVCNLTITHFKVENDTIKFESTVNLINASVIVNYVNATEPKTVNIKVSTEVKAKENEYKFKSEENKTISITVQDVKENPLNVNKTDLKVFDNGNEITNFEFNNTNLTVKLDVGVHTLTIVYKGNETYATSNTTTIVKVGGNQTFNPDKTANLDSDGNAYITLHLSDGADPVNVNVGNLTLTLFYTVGNTTYNKTVSGISLLDDNQTVRFNVAEKFDSAYVDIKYLAENNLTAKTTIKLGTYIDVPTSMEAAGGKVVNFTVSVNLSNGTLINVTVNNTKVYKDGKEIKFTYNDSIIILNDTFTFGDYNITVKYLGNETYSEVSESFMLKVYGINATSSKSINSTKIGEIDVKVINGNETLDVPVSELNLTVTYKDGNITKNITITPVKYENGTLTFVLENGNFTTATLTIRYNDTETNVTLNRIYNIKVVPVNIEAEYQSGNFTFKLVDIDNETESLANKSIGMEVSLTSKTASISYGGSTTSGITFIYTFYATSNDQNEVTFYNKNLFVNLGSELIVLKVGNNTVKLSGTGLSITNASQTVVVNKADINIKVEEYKEYYQSENPLKITVTSAKTGEAIRNTYLCLSFKELGVSNLYVLTNENGTATIRVNTLVGGTYSVNAKNNDTVNINNKSVDGTFTILKIPVSITGKDVTVQYNTGSTYTIKVTKNGKALEGMYVLVRLYTTSSKYSDYLFQTNSKGQVSFSASLAVGKHKIIINSADNRYSASQVTKTITVKKASATITAKKVTTYYKGGKYFTVKLTNSKKKKAIYDGKVNIKIYVSKNRYYNYNGRTGMNGQIKLLLDSLKPGTYKVVVSGADNKNFNAKAVTSKIVIKKAPAKITAKKLTAKKGVKKYFKLTVKNKKTKKVIAKVKVKVKVYTGKKAKTYTLKTNTKGIAKLNVNKLKVGNHKVVITSADKYVVAKTAKSTIKIKK